MLRSGGPRCEVRSGYTNGCGFASIQQPGGDGSPRCPRLAERGHGTWYFRVRATRGQRRQTPTTTTWRIQDPGRRPSRPVLLLGKDATAGAGWSPSANGWTCADHRESLSDSTRRVYTQHVTDYLKPGLGGVPLSELTVNKTQTVFTSLIRLNAARAKPLSPATLQRIRAVLHAALNGAIRRGLITSNPAHWVELPAGGRPKPCVDRTEGRALACHRDPPTGRGVDTHPHRRVPHPRPRSPVVRTVPPHRAARAAQRRSRRSALGRPRPQTRRPDGVAPAARRITAAP